MAQGEKETETRQKLKQVSLRRRKRRRSSQPKKKRKKKRKKRKKRVERRWTRTERKKRRQQQQWHALLQMMIQQLGLLTQSLQMETRMAMTERGNRHGRQKGNCGTR